RGGKSAAIAARNAGPITLRPLQGSDSDNLRKVGESCGVFRPDELESVQRFVEAALEKKAAGRYHWLVAEQDGVAGYACWGTVPLTDGTFQLLALAVARRAQKRGIGWQLLQAVEGQVTASGGKVLI